LLKDPEDIALARKRLGLGLDEPWGDYCSECSPGGEGKWHGLFPKEIYEKGTLVQSTDPDGRGYLMHKETGDYDFRKYCLYVVPDSCRKSRRPSENKSGLFTFLKEVYHLFDL